ncbi:uncharacterized protein LOC133722992 [Rosa rugosa]|uniref:uncharacterized protein LOC133722992 n=1 Tax=Rosa rugosa TaxID=74645 RepID=UPI002B40FD10|nr:uncharacterized protein LOC133722992 [Rosa rugosa]
MEYSLGLAVPNKVKLFLWRACHSFLPCVERLFKRKVCSHDECGRCGRASETVLHCLWECPKSQKVWKKTWLRGFVKHWKELSFTDLVLHVAAVGSQNELELFGLWQIELSRVHTSSVTLQGGQNGGGHETGQQFEGAEPRLFFDGAVDVLKGCVGLGAVILSGTGQLMGAMSIPLPVPIKPIAAEALALWHALKFGRELGVRNVRVYGDALNVLNGLNASGWDLSAIGGVLDAVRLLMREFDIISWKHVKKRSNLVAHKLARSALSLVQAMFCKDVGPPWLHDLIDAV